jgi:hypothetical protein
VLFQRWTLTEGPEWADSLEEAEVADGYFERNLETMRLSLGYDPYFETATFMDDRELRVWSTTDFAAGYRLVVFLEIFPERRTCELKWCQTMDLPPGDDEE